MLIDFLPSCSVMLTSAKKGVLRVPDLIPVIQRNNGCLTFPSARISLYYTQSAAVEGGLVMLEYG